MATIKLKFRASSVPEAEGTLYYQVIHKRSVKWISTGHHVYPNEWNRLTETLVIPHEGDRKAELLLTKSTIDWELKQRKGVISKLENTGNDFSLSELYEEFERLPSCKTIFTFLQEQVSRQERMQRLGTARTYANAYLRFKEFRKNSDLSFGQLTPDMMEEYEAWLTNRGLKQNSIRFYLRTLNSIFGKAVNEGLLDERKKLFDRVHLSYVKTTKRAISETDIRAIQELQLTSGSITALARDIFMFSFYMRGMSFVDIAFLKKSDLKNGILSYCRKKTNQHLTVAWEPEQQEIVERYAHLTKDTPYMLPIIQKMDGTEYKQYQQMQENINRALKKIGMKIGLKMPLSTYVARHSWASIARNMGISICVISEGMGHQSYKTTQVYLDSIDTLMINEANRSIIHRIKKGKTTNKRMKTREENT